MWRQNQLYQSSRRDEWLLMGNADRVSFEKIRIVEFPSQEGYGFPGYGLPVAIELNSVESIRGLGLSKTGESR
ncbi:MAG: hypothetical protein VYA34_06395 [Myxococcota bacterium]|nr:hypothetical protein [Myxococcota bacterium]